MKKIVFLSCKSLDGYVVDDQLVIQKLEQSGKFKVSVIPWDEDTDWSQFDLAIIRTTWDYTQRIDEFLEKMKHIASKTKLLNSYETVKWNYHKGYLTELEGKGIKTVPTVMFKAPRKPSVPTHWNFEKYILKPAVSANAYKTFIISRVELDQGTYMKELHEGDWILQPFLEEIKEGELSLHYFNKKFSHAILKIPKSGDFRVQEEHGGNIISYVPDQALLKYCDQILKQVPFELLYARVDLVPFEDDYLLMELELIEPALYLRMDSEAPENFMKAITDVVS